MLGHWLCVDAAGGVLVGVIGLVGAASLAVSPTYLATASRRASSGAERRRSHYYTALLVFWAALLAVPLAANLGAAWLLVEASTAASALLVAFSGKPRALEAAWKYLVLTSLGLGVALLGVLVLQVAQHRAGGPIGLSYTSIHAAAPGLDHQLALLAYLLLLAGRPPRSAGRRSTTGFPTRIPKPRRRSPRCSRPPCSPPSCSWPGASSRRSPPAWAPAPARHVFIFFGLASLAVAVPFLWRPLAWKRLLAYSSLEHMGVIALGIGFGHPARWPARSCTSPVTPSPSRSASTPPCRCSACSRRPRPTPPAASVAQTPRMGAVVGICLAALAGLPPSPLFVSELMVALGGIKAGYTTAVVVALVLLALGFLGLCHALIEAVAGRRRATRPGIPPGRRPVMALAAGCLVLLPALAGAALALPGPAIADALVRGLS